VARFVCHITWNVNAEREDRTEGRKEGRTRQRRKARRKDMGKTFHEMYEIVS
jgi:hypothetical protein